MNYKEIMEAREIDEWYEIQPSREAQEIALKNWCQGYRGICTLDSDNVLKGETWTHGTSINPKADVIIVCEVTDKHMEYPTEDLFDDEEIGKLHAEYDCVPDEDTAAEFLGVDLMERKINAFFSYN